MEKATEEHRLKRRATTMLFEKGGDEYDYNLDDDKDT